MDFINFFFVLFSISIPFCFPNSHPNFPHSHPDSSHSHPNSLHYSHLDSPHSHPDSPDSHPYSRIPTLILCIFTLIPRIPTLILCNLTLIRRIRNIPTPIPPIPTLILRVPIPSFHSFVPRFPIPTFTDSQLLIHLKLLTLIIIECAFTIRNSTRFSFLKVTSSLLRN